MFGLTATSQAVPPGMRQRRRGCVVNRRGRAEALAFAADGRVLADIELQPLSAINAVFGRMAKGQVPSRVLLDFAG